MDKYRNNLYAVENLKMADDELNKIDISFEKKKEINKLKTKFLNDLLKDTIENFYIIIKKIK